MCFHLIQIYDSKKYLGAGSFFVVHKKLSATVKILALLSFEANKYLSVCIGVTLTFTAINVITVETATDISIAN